MEREKAPSDEVSQPDTHRLRWSWIVLTAVSGIGIVGLSLYLDLVAGVTNIVPSALLELGFGLGLVSVLFLLERKFVTDVDRKIRRDLSLRILLRDHASRERAARVSRTAFARIVASGDLPPTDLDIAIYRRSKLPADNSLIRVAVMRLNEDLETGIRWRVGKGVVGQAFKDGAPIAVNTPLQTSTPLSQEEWWKLPMGVRQGLTRKEYLRIRDRCIIAVPAADPEGTVQYVVVASTSSEHWDAILREDTLEVLQAAATALLP